MSEAFNPQFAIPGIPPLDTPKFNITGPSAVLDLPAVDRFTLWPGLSQVTLEDEAGPIDLSEATVELRVYQDDRLVRLFDTGTPRVTLVDPSQGKIRIEPWVVDLVPWCYRYQIRVVGEDGPQIVLRGNWLIR